MNQSFRFPRIPQLLQRHNINLSPHKSQHFMHNFALCEQIADAALLTPDHWVLEAGTGLANLTTALAQRAGAVHTVEMDESFRPWHQELQKEFPNMHVDYRDFLTVDLAEIVPKDRPIAFVSNVPYQITAPILFKIMESGLPWERMVVVVQYEVAERITAGPKTRRATSLTYKLAYEYESKLHKKIGPQEFIPPPKVNSALLSLTPKPTHPFASPEQRQRVHQLVSGVFQHRRRTLLNALNLAGMDISKEAASAALKTAGIPETNRPENMDLDDFLRLEQALFNA
ncbi:MAG: 16S rRNA (adenine(1518)-N(6)/adenine(1519)-N(6))-dimethyltransferase RsmA [Sumerlaeia bacterium]